jgi:hypothetical protein
LGSRQVFQFHFLWELSVPFAHAAAFHAQGHEAHDPVEKGTKASLPSGLDPPQGPVRLEAVDEHFWGMATIRDKMGHSP